MPVMLRVFVAWLCTLPAPALAAPSIVRTSVDANGVTVAFSDPMVTWGTRDDAGPATITPPLACAWTWHSDTELRCDIGEGDKPRPATRYTVRFTEALWLQSGERFTPPESGADHERPYLSAAVMKWEDGRPVFALMPHAPVDVAAAHEVLRVRLDDGSEVPYDIDPAPRGTGYVPGTLRLRLPRIEGANRTVSLDIADGLRSSAGDLRGYARKQLIVAHVNETFRWRDAGCGNGSDATPPLPVSGTIACPPRNAIELRFSRRLSPASVEALRKRLPQRALLEYRDDYLTADRKDVKQSPGSIVAVTLDAANTETRIDLPATLLSTTGEALAPASLLVRTGNYPPAITIAGTWKAVAPGSRMPARITASNVTDLTVAQLEIGADSARHVEGARVDARGQERVLPAPAVSRALRRGGLAVGRVEATGLDSRRLWSRYITAFAPFNVTASTTASHALVWATRWKGAAPIAGAKVEILRIDSARQLVLLASGKTSADGVASIALPATEEPTANPEQLPLLVRVRDGDDVSVMPLDRRLVDSQNATAEKELYFYWDIDEEGARVAWGVSDRPLYRAGENVDYRLWLRERHLNHWRAVADDKPQRVILESHDKEIRRWEEPLDAFGATAGRLQLPAGIDDGDYCIRFDADRRSDAGACFAVQAFRANDLTATLTAEQPLVHEGEAVGFDAHVGYYSGGGAAGAAVTWEATLVATSLNRVYPAWRYYRFAHPDDDNQAGWQLDAGEFAPATTDAQGNARVTPRLRGAAGKAPAFATASVTARVAAGDGLWVTSPPVLVHMARHARYVGLNVLSGSPPESTDTTIDAVVVGADGVASAGDTVQVDIYRDTGDDTAKATPVAHCEAVAGKPGPCAFRPARGHYRLVARSGDAAPTEADLYVQDQPPAPPKDETLQTSLTLAETQAGDAARQVRLIQPYRRARVLFAAEHGEILHYWIQTVDATTSIVDVPADPQWSPGFTLRAVVLDADARRLPAARVAVETAHVEIPVATPAPQALVDLELDRREAAPGDTVTLILHNRADRPLQTTVSMLDDAVRELVPERAAQADPLGESWLGRLRAWRTTPWSSLGEWAARQDESFTAIDYGIADRSDLETIVVTGSRIRRVGLETASPVFVIAGNTGDPGALATGNAAPRLRGRFVSSAYWAPGIVLQAGERRELRVTLPGNLTRWRVLAWSNDTGDAFGLAQATLEAKSPLELRLALPTRLHTGDRATLGVSVGNRTDAARTIAAGIRAQGAGLDQRAAAESTIAARAQMPLDLVVQPAITGNVTVTAQAQGNGASDATAATFDVAGTRAHERTVQAGWIGAKPLHLALPSLPTGAAAPTLRLTIARGPWTLAEGWIVALRDYPHTCWEQQLSRAVGAAVAIKLGLAPRLWPDAPAVVRQTLDTARSYQAGGDFRYFVDTGGGSWPASPFLTAYTLRAFAVLRELGHEPPEGIEADAASALRTRLDAPRRPDAAVTDETAALLGALAGRSPLPPVALNDAWERRDRLSGYGYAELIRALAADASTRDRASALLEDALATAQVRGPRLILRERASLLSLGTPLRDQCNTIDVLHAFDAKEQRTPALLAGLVDVYAGGAPVLDTQASAQCLIALLHAMPPPDTRAATVTIRAGGIDTRLPVTGDTTAQWRWPGAALPADVELRADDTGGLPLGYTLEIAYTQDQRVASREAVGFALQRRYTVLRDQAWQPLAAGGVRAGDWVRVTLVLANSAMRRFVAVSDVVPGGLRPADPSFAGVGTPAFRALASNGDWWFGARRVDERDARFYAEYLPPGRHEVHYYARAQFSGTFFAPPARAELMYGAASVARTAPASIAVQPERKP